MRKRLVITLLIVALLLFGFIVVRISPDIFGSLIIQLPDEYRPKVEQYAGQAGVDPCFLAAIVQAESRWNPRAKSYVGASGLGQLMPGTAASVARLYGVKYSPSQIYDPDTNLQLAAYLLHYNISKYGSIRNVLVAYNAGGGRVRLPDSALPRETQRYIKTVSTYYSLFRSSYPDFCQGSGDGRGTGVGPGGVGAPRETFEDFPEVETEQNSSINLNDLWKNFLGF